MSYSIPFAVVENVFFVAFVKALNPGYAKFLPGRDKLRTSILDDVYEETLVSTSAVLNSTPGKRTLVLDGKTNVVGRATCNIGEGKEFDGDVGFHMLQPYRTP